MVDEIKSLIGLQSPNCPTENFPEPITPEELMYYGLEYKYVTLYAIGEMTYEEMFEKIKHSHTTICKTTNDMVQRNGTTRHKNLIGLTHLNLWNNKYQW